MALITSTPAESGVFLLSNHAQQLSEAILIGTGMSHPFRGSVRRPGRAKSAAHRIGSAYAST